MCLGELCEFAKELGTVDAGVLAPRGNKGVGWLSGDKPHTSNGLIWFFAMCYLRNISFHLYKMSLDILLQLCDMRFVNWFC